MARSIDSVLPEQVSGAVKDAFEAKLKRKLRTAVGLVVKVVRIVEEEYGPEAKELIRKRLRESPREKQGDGDAAALKAFCTGLEGGCAGSHEWRRTEQTDRKVAYEFTRCMWAELYRELGAEDIGIWCCDGDEPAAQAWGLGFERSKTLMEGDEVCDHVFFVPDRADAE